MMTEIATGAVTKLIVGKGALIKPDASGSRLFAPEREFVWSPHAMLPGARVAFKIVRNRKRRRHEARKIKEVRE